MRIVTGTFVCAALAVGVAWGEEPMPSGDLTVVTLMKRALERDFAPDREVIVDLVEIPPNTTLDRHWHPGEEFHYYLEGAVEVAIDGEPSITGTPGTVGHVPYKKTHTATTGKSGAKILVFRVHQSGAPMGHVEKDGSPPDG